MNSERKNYPMKDFRAIFPISSILAKMYAKKGQFSILAVFQNVWDLHKFELQILILECKNYPMKEISCNFSDFIDFGHQIQVCKKRSVLNISCNSKYMGFTYFWVADLNSQRKNYPMKEFRAIFSIHRFWSSGPGIQKKIFSQY